MREVDWQSAEEYRSWVDHLLYGSDILLKSKKDWSWIPAADLLARSYVLLGKHQLIMFGSSREEAEQFLQFNSINVLCGINSSVWQDAHRSLQHMQQKYPDDFNVQAFRFELHLNTLMKISQRDYVWELKYHRANDLLPDPRTAHRVLLHLLNHYVCEA